MAIIGRFKAGKSSFLNSIIGKPVLPAGVIPVTTVITRLAYARSEEATVTFLDNRLLRIEKDSESLRWNERGKKGIINDP
ncbi:MAG: dynamin family protein [Syntrophorhabdaceae bacterium]|nr:dynamin family protein [Syntrophorhabdaceae bacterium]